MTEELRALAVEKRLDDANSLANTLGPEIEFSDFEFTNSILKAVRSHAEVQYEICFISEDFPVEELGPFFEDMKAMNRDLGCVFVQVRENIEPGFDRSSLQDIGIDYVISRDGTQRDKEGIGEQVSIKLGNDEIKRRVMDVSSAMDVLLRELDIAAANKKRGRQDSSQLYSLSIDFITMQTNFDEEVLSRYYQTLSKKAEEAEPSIADKLHVPDSILEKELPELSKTGYKGASHRVWKKLMRQHGVMDSKTSAYDGASQRVLKKTEAESADEKS